MRKIRLNKLPALGTLIVVMSFFVLACGGETLSLVVLTPTPEPTPVPTLAPTQEPAATPTLPTAAEPTLAPAQSPTTAPILPPASEPTVAPTASPTLAPTAIATEPPKDSSIELTMAILKRSPDNKVSVLEDGGVMTSKDNYGIFFEPTRDAYVYIFQQDTTKAIDVLFPNPAFSPMTNPVSAGTKVWVPKDIDFWFFLDQNVGREDIIVVATREQNKELEAIIAGKDRADVLGPLAKFLVSESRGVGGVKERPVEPLAFTDGSIRDLEQKLLQGDGDDFVYSIQFDHK